MVLSEPLGRTEARAAYGKVPPRKRPALGRRYRPEQDFSSGLRRRDDRRTGTPDPCSAALYGRPTIEEPCILRALRCIRKGSHSSRSRRLLASDGPQKEDLCQRCGSLPVLLAASAVRSQKRYLRQEIAWSRQPAIRSSLSSFRADTPGKFVLSRSM